MTAIPHPHPNELLAFVLAEEGEAGRRGVEEHLTACAGCRAEVGRLTETLSTLEAWPEEEPPAGGLARVLTTVHDAAPLTPRRDDWLWPVVASLVGVVSGSLVIYAAGMLLFARPSFSGFSLAALVFFGIGSLVTLALAPMLLLELQARPQRLVAR